MSLDERHTAVVPLDVARRAERRHDRANMTWFIRPCQRGRRPDEHNKGDGLLGGDEEREPVVVVGLRKETVVVVGRGGKNRCLDSVMTRL